MLSLVWACYNTSIRQVGPRYLNIATELRSKIIDGTFGANQVMPSEAVLSSLYEASRITVRKALEVLRKEGYVDSRQGFGWLVVSPPLRQMLGRFSTIEEQMAEMGVRPRRKVLDSEICSPSPQIAQILGDQEMLRVRRVNLADELPFARVTVWIPSILAKDFSLSDYERNSFYELLTSRKVIKRPLSRALQTISAIAISAEDAKLLEVPVGSPALRCLRTTYDSVGEAILFSEYVFPGHLTEFVIELVGGVTSIAPSGLRLVD
jgi:GntR family transcriptional regulator